MLLSSVIEPGFFHFTAQGVIGICAMIGIGWKLIQILRKFDRNVAQVLWEHEVMWQYHCANFPVPPYPLFERRREKEKKSEKL